MSELPMTTGTEEISQVERRRNYLRQRRATLAREGLVRTASSRAEIILQQRRAEQEVEEYLALIYPIDSNEDWQEDALCKQTDPEAFFSENIDTTRQAKRVCGSCVVAAACLTYALENNEEFGVWGGMSEDERRQLKNELQSSRVG